MDSAYLQFLENAAGFRIRRVSSSLLLDQREPIYCRCFVAEIRVGNAGIHVRREPIRGPHDLLLGAG